MESSGGVALWDPSSLQLTRRLWGNLRDPTNPNLSPDARWAVRSDGNGRLHIWDVRSGLETTNFIAAPGGLRARNFTANGKFLVTLYGPVTNLLLQVWDAETWQRMGSASLHFTNFQSINSIFTPSLPNSLVIVADRALHFFDVSKLNEAPKLIETQDVGEVFALATSPDGRTAAGADRNTGSVRLWDLATLKPMKTLTGYVIGVMSVAFTPDGRRLAAGSGGQEAVKLWDTETWQEVVTLSGTGVFSGFLEFSPDEHYLLGRGDGYAHLWSAPTLAEIEAAEAKKKPTPALTPWQQDVANP